MLVVQYANGQLQTKVLDRLKGRCNVLEPGIDDSQTLHSENPLPEGGEFIQII